jgi:hypothetical protein
MNTSHSAMLQEAARMWLDLNKRDVAEIRLDDLLNPHADDPIVSIDWLSDDGRYPTLLAVQVLQESGIETRIWLGGPIDQTLGGPL